MSSLKCYQGIGSASTLKDCPAGMDRCVKMTESGAVMGSCHSSAAMRVLGISDGECKDISGVSTCYCSTDGCNGDTSSGGSSTSSGSDSRIVVVGKCFLTVQYTRWCI